MPSLQARDQSTLSNYDEVRVQHLELAPLAVDFHSKMLSGRVTLSLVVLAPQVRPLYIRPAV
jgi:hypothetical protein